MSLRELREGIVGGLVLVGCVFLLGSSRPAFGAEGSVGIGEGEVTSVNRISLGGEIIFVGSKITGSHECRFSEWGGWFEPAGGKVEGGRIEILLKTASVVGDFKDPGKLSAKLEKHLRGEDFLYSSKFPEARFTSSSIRAIQASVDGNTHVIKGLLTIKGVSKEVFFPASVRFEGGKVEGAAELTINRKDFNIKYDGRKDDLISESVVLKFLLKGAA